MSHRLKKYKDGSIYITGGIASIEPNVDYEPEEYDLDELNKEELDELKRNPKSKKFDKKMKRIK